MGGREAPGHAPPWRTCEAVLSEAIPLLGARGAPGLSALLRRRALIAAFNLDNDLESVLRLLQKYADVRFRFPHLSPAQPADGSLCDALLTMELGSIQPLKLEDDRQIDLETGDVGLHATPVAAGNTVIVGAAHVGQLGSEQSV